MRLGPVQSARVASLTVRPDADLDPRAALTAEATRVTDRLRGLALDRLTRRDEDGRTPAERARAAAQVLADLAASSAGREPREVPELAPHGVADQVAVTASDVLAEGDEPALREALVTLVELRRSL